MRAPPGLLVAVVAALLVTVVAGLRRGASDPVPALRATRHALVAGLRAMSSLAWFPLVLLLFQLTETAILVRDAVRGRCADGHRCEP